VTVLLETPLADKPGLVIKPPSAAD